MPSISSLLKEQGGRDFKGICVNAQDKLVLLSSKQKLGWKEVVTRLATKSIILILFLLSYFHEFSSYKPSRSSWIWVPFPNFKARILVSGAFQQNTEKYRILHFCIVFSIQNPPTLFNLSLLLQRSPAKAEMCAMTNVIKKSGTSVFPSLQWA